MSSPISVVYVNHPHICTLHDVGHQDGIDYLVMEHLEGQTLAARLREGPLPLDQALSIAREIADALDDAHCHGIIHRDLKPANVMLTKTGAKVLDFGLAKAVKVAAGPAGASSVSAVGGLIVGTPAYMSPDQAQGKAADHRADIWSFGVVLYQMLAGKMAFTGESVSDTVASALKLEPDWSALPDGTPAEIRRLLWRCLQKDRQRRLQAIGDARRRWRGPGLRKRRQPRCISRRTGGSERQPRWGWAFHPRTLKELASGMWYTLYGEKGSIFMTHSAATFHDLYGEMPPRDMLSAEVKSSPRNGRGTEPRRARTP